MAKSTIPRGETSVIRHVFIMDSASTTGGGKTGLAYNTAGISAYYIYAGGTKTALTLEDITTLGTYAAPTSAAHMRFKLIDDTNMPGWYEVQFHNDWYSVASARKTACVQMKGASGMAPLNMEFDVVGMELQSAAPKVDVDTIKTQAVTCGAGVTVLAQVGAAGAPGAANGLVTTNGTKVNQTVDLTAGQSIACSDKTGFSLAATGADLILKSSTFIQAIVAAVNEFATYGLTALNTLLVTTGIKVGSIANNAITANAINDGAITNAKVADDVDVNVKTMTAGVITSTVIADGAIDAATFAAGAIDAAAIAAGAIDAATLAADMDAELRTIIWNAPTADYGGAGTYGQAVEDILADTNELQVDDYPTSIAAIKTVVDVIQADTDLLDDAAGGLADIHTDVAAVKTVVDAVKLQTDKLTFEAVTNHIEAAVQNIAADAIDADALKADAITEIQNGLATAAALTTVDTVVDLIEDIVRNKMEITDANGNLVLYADDSTTPLYSVAACVTDDLTTTTRKRLA